VANGFTTAFPILYTEDLAGALAFYRDLLGCEETFRFPSPGEPEFVALRLGSAQLALAAITEETKPIHGKRLRPISGHRFEMCVYTDDIKAAFARLRESGVPVLAEPHDQPWGERIGYVEDPDGNPVLLAMTLTSS
jgi:lactoylglutathione lyase